MDREFIMHQREQILEQAKGLPPGEQVQLIQELEDHLLAIVPPQAEESAGIHGTELLEELQRRSARYRDGTTTARPAEEVMRDLRRRQIHEATS
jgi:putative addiction module component (TIGR02574 family)